MPVSAELTQTESRGRGKNQARKQKDPSVAQFTRLWPVLLSISSPVKPG